MDKFKASVVSSGAKRDVLRKGSDDKKTEKTSATIIEDSIKLLTGKRPSSDTVEGILNTLGIDGDDVLDDSKSMLLYNYLCEPLIVKKNYLYNSKTGKRKEVSHRSMMAVLNNEKDTDSSKVDDVGEFDQDEMEIVIYDFTDNANQDKSFFSIYKKALANLNELISDSEINLKLVYNTFPSLENARLNYAIEKEAYQSKSSNVKGTHKCPKCGSESTITQYIQTRSADEPMTAKIFCLDCQQISKKAG
jgi:DNA-directed RNA polymerase subunit M/transcription elongation factor TFIIS